MKKLFTLGALGLCMALNASAANPPANQAFYLVGTMNGWICPSTDEDTASWDYKLTDPDGDGVFTGAFELPAGALQFKLFAGPGDWMSADYYGSNSNVYLLQTPYELMLEPGYGSGNINIKNWKGGTLTISARWTENEYNMSVPTIVMEGTNQPSEIVKPDNDTFYLVGDVTMWECPTVENAAEWPYRITDPDGDGIYSAEFDLPANSSNFKILTNPGNWDVNGNYGFGGSICVFDTETTIILESDGAPISVSNWEGGKMNISIQWINPSENEWVPEMAMSGLEQPQRPAFPDFYLIGDFNGWKLPAVGNDNGALPFVIRSEGPSSNFTELSKEMPANSELKFGVCGLDPVSGKVTFYNPVYHDPFTLYSFISADGQQKSIPSINMKCLSSEDNDKDKYSFTVKDWKGGELIISYVMSFGVGDYIYISGYGCPPLPAPEGPFYIVSDIGYGKQVTPIDGAPLTTSVSFSTGGNIGSILLTTENSTNPAPENCWGIATTLSEAGFDFRHPDGILPLVKGGNPVAMDFPVSGGIYAFYDFSTSIIVVSLSYDGRPFAADKLYICGDVMTSPDGEYNNFTTPSAANQALYDQYWRLDEIEPGVFSKAFYVPEKEPDYIGTIYCLPQFRFFTDLKGWTNEASIGADEPDFSCIPVDLSDGPKQFNVVTRGLGNWGMNKLSDGYDWSGAWVRVVVDSNTGVARFEKVASGVQDIDADETLSESWYNLQGVKVDRPSNGIFIHVRNGKSSVEMVR